MKKLLIVCLLFISNLSYAQVEKGDVSANFNLLYASVSGFGFGMLSGKVGYYVTQNLEVGVTPQIIFGDFGAFGLGAYGTYNFLRADAKLLPYIGGSLSMLKPEGVDALVSIGAYGGSKYFLTEALFVDGGLNITGAITPSGGGVLFIAQVGVGFIFGKLK